MKLEQPSREIVVIYSEHSEMGENNNQQAVKKRIMFLNCS